MPFHGSRVSPGQRKNDESSATGCIYRVAGLDIDPVQASVRREGQQIPLRPKTYRFLLYLLEHHNRVVTKEELIEKVWDGASVSDGVLVRSVVELRKAFADDAKDSGIIKTFPKMGYGLMAPVELVTADPGSPQAAENGAPREGFRIPRIPVAVAATIVVLAVAGVIGLGWRNRPIGQPYREAAWWRLGDVRGRSVPDASGNGLDGTLAVDPLTVLGKSGSALWFDGFHTEVTGSGGALPYGNSARTITAWFQAALPHVDDSCLFNYGAKTANTAAGSFFLYLQQDGRLNLSGGSSLTGTGHWADDHWHFVAASYDGPERRTARIFVDGELDSEQQFGTEPATLRNGGWKIGSFLVSGANFRGAMQDVRVYPLALTPAVVAGIYRCSAEIHDVDGYYYLPVFSSDTVIGDRGPEDVSTPFWHKGKDVGGIQLAKGSHGCGLGYLQGADVGQDLYMAADLAVPLTEDKKPTIAGPYFRSRLAAAGDGLIGGTSAGYWVQLSSDGMVKVKRLNPWAMVAFSEAKLPFDASVFHHLETEVRGEGLEVWLDGKEVLFDQGGSLLTRVQVPSAWLGPPAVGNNQGAAGIAFGTMESDRGRAGGQRVRNLQVRRLDLTGQNSARKK